MTKTKEKSSGTSKPAVKVKPESLASGSILSEHTFYKVKSVKKKSTGEVSVIAIAEPSGKEVTLSGEYVRQMLTSADQVTATEVVTATELAEILLKNKNIAMSCTYIKKVQEKSKKAYDAEVKAAIQKISEAKLTELEPLVLELIDKPITKTHKPEIRTAIGRHEGHMTSLQRLLFIDMQIDWNGKGKDPRYIQVDPRTLLSVTVGGVKYIKE